MLTGRKFPGSSRYWESRYAAGLHSGDGSHGILAAYKAELLNNLVARQNIETVIEFGCGDGNQLSLAKYPHYTGIDVSETAVEICRKRFKGDPSKMFYTTKEYSGQEAELSLSLDVIYHLVEDDVFETYMETLFGGGTKMVVIYSTCHDESYGRGAHVRHRNFKEWTTTRAKEWKNVERISNLYQPRSEQDDRSKTSPADFFIFTKTPLSLET